MSLHLKLDDLQSGYLTVVEAVLDGEVVVPRGLPTRELVDATLEFSSTDNLLPVGTGAGVSVKIAAANAAQLVGGVHYPSLLGRVLASYEGFDSDGVDREGYGQRGYGQVLGSVRRLVEDPSSRQAIVTLQPPSTSAADGGKVFPCTTSLQFLLRDGRLDLVASMRSNDVLRGLSTDAWTFTRLQRTVAWVLGVQPGRYYHHAASLHVYERDMERLLGLHSPDRGPLDVDGFCPDSRRSDSRARAESRWTRAQTWARGALGLGTGAPATRPSNVDWYYDQLRGFWTISPAVPILCWACRRVREAPNGRASLENGRTTRCQECTRNAEARRPNRTDTDRRSGLLRLHGITQADYDALLVAQDGACAICHKVPETGRWGPSFTIDHDHDCCPGKFSCGSCVRGLLCNRCNPMIGFAQDDPERLEAGAQYLRSK